jgi:dihydroorotate dehydrogenase electron transfer subunit
MLDKKARVKEIQHLGGPNSLLILSSPEQARLVQPGQFVMLKCNSNLHGEPLLRRPFSIFDVQRSGVSGKPSGIALLVKDVGVGSHWLSQLRNGDFVWTLGPQGKPFRIAADAGTKFNVACLVAGGVGIGALYLLARTLFASGVTPVLFYGGRSAEDLVLREHFERDGFQTHYSTEDGSLGHRGVVTQALEPFIARRSAAETVLFACGPWAMMKAVHEVAVRYRMPCEVSLEARMGCSLGACMGCVVRTFDSDGQEQFLRVCLEGPVMDSRVVDWETSPF